MERDLLKELEREAERINEDTDYSSKGHFEASSTWQKVNLWIGIPNVVFAAVAGVSVLEEWKVVAVVFAAHSVAFAALNTFLGAADKAATHKRFGNEYLTLRNRSRYFVNIKMKRDLDESELEGLLEDHFTRRDDLNCSAPIIPRHAFERARRGIEEGESKNKID